MEKFTKILMIISGGIVFILVSIVIGVYIVPFPHFWNKDTAELRAKFGMVYSVAFSPDNTILAIGSDDHLIRIYDIGADKLKWILRGHESVVRSVAFSSDGETLASGDTDGLVQLWNVLTGTLKQTFKGHKAAVRSVAFSPDNSTLASGSGDKTVILWDVETGKIRQTLKGFSSWVLAVAFSPDGKMLACGSGGFWNPSRIEIWDTQTWKLNFTLQDRSTGGVLSVAFSPDGKTLASGNSVGQLKLWNAEMRVLKHSIEVSDSKFFVTGGDNITSVAYSSEGKIVCGIYNSMVKVWNEEGKLELTLKEIRNWVESIAITSDGKTICSGSGGMASHGEVRLWDAQTGNLKRLLKLDELRE